MNQSEQADLDTRAASVVLALADLTPRERQALELRAEGLSHAAVSVALGVSRARAAELWRVARAKMRHRLHIAELAG